MRFVTSMPARPGRAVGKRGRQASFAAVVGAGFLAGALGVTPLTAQAAATAARAARVGAVSPSLPHAAHRSAATVRSGAIRAISTASPTLYVATTGTDGTTCRLKAHPCLTINYALAQAAASAPGGAIISVGAGTFPEQLSLSSNVTIKGAGSGSGGTIIAPTALTTVETDTDSDNPQAVIAYVPPGLTANFSGLQFNGSAGYSTVQSCAIDYVGVYYRDSAGTVSNTQFVQMNQGAGYYGCQNPDGGVYVATDSGTTAPGGAGDPTQWVPPPSGWAAADVTLNGVKVTNYQKNGVTCDDVGTVCTVKNSTVTGIGPTDLTAENGIQVWGASATISGSTVTGNSYTSPYYSPPNNYTYYTASGILVINADALTISSSHVTYNDANVYALWYPPYGSVPTAQGAWSITGNTVSHGTNNTGTTDGATRVPFGDGFGDGIDLDGPTGVTVSGNHLYGNAEYGIGLLDAQSSLVQNNTTNNGAGDGIYVGDNPFTGTSGIAANTGATSASTVTGNTSDYNHVDGILADVVAQDSGNSFTSNSLSRNLRYDAEDLSGPGGGGTAGTANTWTTDVCNPAADSFPAGLC